MVGEGYMDEPVKKIQVSFTEAELFKLSEFFGDDSTIDDETYDRVGRRFFIAAVKAGLYDESEWAE